MVAVLLALAPGWMLSVCSTGPAPAVLFLALARNSAIMVPLQMPACRGVVGWEHHHGCSRFKVPEQQHGLNNLTQKAVASNHRIFEVFGRLRPGSASVGPTDAAA